MPGFTVLRPTAVTSTTVSDMRTMTAALAWRAIAPVSSVTVCFPNGSDFLKGVIGSATQAKTLDEVLVALLIGLLQVVEQLAALVDHHQQPTTRVVIFLVRGEVPRQAVDTLRQQRDLDF